jgi:hypothetical protein
LCRVQICTIPQLTLQSSLHNFRESTTIFQLSKRAKWQHLWVGGILLAHLVHTTIIAQPKVPSIRFPHFQTLNTQASGKKLQTNNFNNPISAANMPLGLSAADVQTQVNLLALQQMGAIRATHTQQNQAQQLAALIQEESLENYNVSLAHFQSYLSQLLQLNPNNFSITKAVYLCEAVYDHHPITYPQFLKAIQQRAGLVKQILKQEGMSLKNSYEVHYAIQKLFAQNVRILRPNNSSIIIKKIEYDFNDFLGEQDYRNTFVAKLLQTNSGQCRSMPLLYLCIAEQLQTKAWLALAPQHSFIKFVDKKGNLSNFEATNGHTVSTTWLLQCNAISSIALKNKTYLDTLSSRKLFAQCLADFQLTYLVKFGYNNFTNMINQQILAIDSCNINAIMYNSNIALLQFNDLLKKYNNPTPQQIANNSTWANALKATQLAQKKVNDLGYQDMPKAQYLQWLQSIELEKRKRHLQASK